jgi:hypothetical protein
MIALHLVDEGKLDVPDRLERAASAQPALKTAHTHDRSMRARNNRRAARPAMSNDTAMGRIPNYIPAASQGRSSPNAPEG